MKIVKMNLPEINIKMHNSWLVMMPAWRHVNSSVNITIYNLALDMIRDYIIYSVRDPISYIISEKIKLQ